MRICTGILILLLAFPALAGAEVVVRDDVAVTGETVMLAARTKGLILPRGGEIVEFSVDGASLGRNLSGGDGWAYREFMPRKAKLYVITATSGREAGKGYLLALREGRGIVFIDVHGSLFKTPLSQTPMEGSREAVENIIKRSPVAYLYTDLPDVAIKAWLDKHDFPEAPVLGWRGGRVFDYVVGKGLKVKAVVGSADVAGSALGYDSKLFTFEAFDEAQEVEGWEEIEEAFE